LKEGIFMAFKLLVGFALVFSHLVHGLIEELFDMEAVKDDHRLAKCGGDPADKGRRKIYTNLLDLRGRGIFTFQIVFNSGYCSRSFAGSGMEHIALVHIHRYGYVVMAFLGAGFINTQVGYSAVVGLAIGPANPVVKDGPYTVGI